jgi:hypothetical protein
MRSDIEENRGNPDGHFRELLIRLTSQGHFRHLFRNSPTDTEVPHAAVPVQRSESQTHPNRIRQHPSPLRRRPFAATKLIGKTRKAAIMPIPPFDPIYNTLPPHLGDPRKRADMSPYPTTVSEICQRFGTSPERKAILLGLLALREEFLSRGITGFQWIDGSFLEDIELIEGRPPGDIDVVTFVEVPHDSAALAVQLIGTVNLLDHDWVKSSFKVDHFLVPLCSHPRLIVDLTRYWFGLFSHRRDGLWKGMLEVPLQDTTDHTAAKSFL